MNFLLSSYFALKKISNRITRLVSRLNNQAVYQSFYKSKGKIGIGVKFGRNVTISGFDHITIGNNVHIGSGCFIRGEGGLIIDDNVIISRNVVIYSVSHNYAGTLLPFDHSLISNQVVIGKNVWIGMNATISPGTVIGEGAIVGLGSRIFGKVPRLAIVGSADFRVIKLRNEEHYRELDSNKLFAKEGGRPLNDIL